jgi:general secretion pathway protein A
MYAQYFGLKQDPFSIAPDPRYLFMSERHREALAHLLYGLGGGGGFVLLSGEIGAGKTTVCRCFLEQIPRRCNVAYIFNPKLTVTELLKTVCDEFRVPVEHIGPGSATVKDYTDPLNEFLLKTHSVGQSSVLIIDEAQNLSADVLEQLRLLTNLETNERKLLQIILIGQPELRSMLARPELEQLAQRVIARYHLDALSEAETAQYIRHRLAVSGMSRAIPFDARALRRIHQLSRGIPRRINLLCDRALLGAYASGKTDVDAAILDKAAGEVFDKPPSSRQQLARRRAQRRTAVALALGVATGAALLGVTLLGLDMGREVPVGGDAIASPAALAGASPRLVAASAPASSPQAAAAASAPTDAPPLRSRLAALPRTEEAAWRELAPLWKVDAGDGDPCRAAQQQQVYCHRNPGSNLALIRALGRPGIVTLQADDGPAYAVLTGLSDDAATLRIGGAAQTVPLGALAQVWRGDFATFWRAPPGYLGRVGTADTGPAAQWLAERLAVPGTPDDAPLKSRIHAFQLAHGLEPDGLAGPMTYMQLNRASGVDEPRLQTGK